MVNITSTPEHVCKDQITDPSAWYSSDYASNENWIYHLTQSDIDELNSAIAHIHKNVTPIYALTPETFPLPHLRSRFAKILKEVDSGRGFALIRGIPVENYSQSDLESLYLGLGSYFGTFIHQNSVGDLLGHVKSQGYDDYHGNRDIRGYQTHAQLEFHTDVVDIVALLCVNEARSGGESAIASSITIHNEMLQHDPLSLGLLYGNFLWDKKGEEAAGDLSYFISPIYNLYKGFVSCRMGVPDYLFSAETKTGIPLSDAQREAISLFLSYAARPDIQLTMHLKRGDIQFVNNSVVVHSRTAFVDYDDLDKRRHLLRLWLNVNSGRPVDYTAFPYSKGVPLAKSVSATHRIRANA